MDNPSDYITLGEIIRDIYTEIPFYTKFTLATLITITTAKGAIGLFENQWRESEREYRKNIEDMINS